MKKNSYFQGSGKENEPTPKNKKYKDEPVNHELTKARGVLFKNYDLYDTGGPGPGTGLYQHMNEYDSVADFRKKKRKEKIRKRRQALFEALMVSTASAKEDKLEKLRKMLNQFGKMITEDSNNLTDPTENTTTPIPFNPSEPAGPLGLTDGIYPKEDLENNPIGSPYYGMSGTYRVEAKKK